MSVNSKVADQSRMKVCVETTDVYNTLAEGCVGWWQQPVALWYKRKAVSHANMAYKAAHWFTNMNLDQITILVTAWCSLPGWLGGNPSQARRALEVTLSEEHPAAKTIKAHEQILFLIVLAQIQWDVPAQRDEAWQLIPAIKEENPISREGVEAISAIGFSYYDRNYGDHVRLNRGMDVLREALVLARRASLREEVNKILVGCQDRGIKIE